MSQCADMEFITIGTSDTCVKHFWPGVKCSRINANNYPFFVIFLKARDVLAFNKISGVSLYLGRQFVQIFE